MYFKYGNYTHDAGEITFSISRESQYNAYGVQIATIERWTIQGQVHADSVSDLTDKIDAIERAYSDDNRSFGLYTDSGSATSHTVSAADTTYIHVVNPPSFPASGGAEYTTFRNYSIQIEVRYGSSGYSAIPLVSFNETISVTGGGPRRILIEVLNGPPQEQITCLETAYVATQSGRAVGRADYPIPPAPLWPLSQPPLVEKESPEKKTGEYTNYGIRWQYQYQSATPLVGNPNVM